VPIGNTCSREPGRVPGAWCSTLPAIIGLSMKYALPPRLVLGTHGA
jgi:hypothetical protein